MLFGLLGLFLVYAALRPSLQPMAFVAGFVSVASFMTIAWSVGGYNDAIRKVIIADVVALVALFVAGILFVIGREPAHRGSKCDE